jgi:hypothetical protein
LIWILLFAVSVSLLELLLTTFYGNPQVQSIISRNWAGYAVTSDPTQLQPNVIGVNASWTVPRIRASTVDTFSSAWIGIGGQFDETLIQAGTEHDFIGGQAQYSIWYEVLPENAIAISNVSISPGDVIAASISLINSDANEWSIQINDVTTGQGFSQSCCLVYNSSRLSAEWIVERPNINNQLSTLADFGSITFKNAYANINSTYGTIASFPYSQVIMNSLQNVRLASVSPIDTNGSAFTITYIRSG